MLQTMLFLAQGPIKHDGQTDGSEIGSALIKRLQSGEAFCSTHKREPCLVIGAVHKALDGRRGVITNAFAVA